ncbi:hypothetical protein DICVIV_12556 [Dictyocaulus viviparus]|uniref:Uncharacterized protein n=1 Tax=Dictyocaulus viviparus TaxID=29172 RepID=A0A0D8XCI1_DICVI|nr:hypothetical protein DICVIV_12556 [Dictyocaulus viviparus]
MKCGLLLQYIFTYNPIKVLDPVGEFESIRKTILLRKFGRVVNLVEEFFTSSINCRSRFSKALGNCTASTKTSTCKK